MWWVPPEPMRTKLLALLLVALFVFATDPTAAALSGPGDCGMLELCDPPIYRL